MPRDGERDKSLSSPSGRVITPIPVDVAVDALMRYTGVIGSTPLNSSLKVGHGLVSQPLPRGRRVAILSNRGGPAPLAQDSCEAAGLVVPTLAKEPRASLRLLVPKGRLSNPVKLASAADSSIYAKALELLLGDPGMDAVIVLYIPTVAGRVPQRRPPSGDSIAAGDQTTDTAPALRSARAVAQSASPRCPSRREIPIQNRCWQIFSPPRRSDRTSQT